MKKGIVMLMIAAMAVGAFAGCGGSNSAASDNTSSETSTEATATPEASSEDADASADSAVDAEEGGDSTASYSGPINVVSREDGSGTRGAFTELFEIEVDGEDMTTQAAQITNNTSVMMTTVGGDASSIGYISLGSLDDTVVKAVQIDGVDATVDNVLSGDYSVSRPFNIVTTEGVSESAQDFISYILSTEGQAIVEEKGYIPLQDTEAYSGTGATEKITVAGSSSVSPVMEKLIEAYKALYPDADIELNTSDSTTGVTNAIEGVCDIGMASRALKDEELSQGVTGTVIATDGIAVIVNLENPIENLTTEQVQGIYMGEITDWSEIQ
jgi:phosphate transport system substrate-binding protein